MNYAIILGGGKSSRMGKGGDKLFLPIHGKPLIYYTLMHFNDHPEIDEIIVAIGKKNQAKLSEMVKQYRFKKVKQIVLGGTKRQESFFNAFNALPKKIKKDDIVLVHNAANPLVSSHEIAETIHHSKDVGACIVGHFINATVKEVSGMHVLKTHNRDQLFAAETPQAAKYGNFLRAIDAAKKRNLNVTDEAMLLEAIEQKIVYIEASENNFKITREVDFNKLKAVMGELPEDIRVGIGQDSHEFDKTLKGLMLGGFLIPDQPKLKANSDGDVVLHAIFNAISQAIGERSIGFYADKICEKGVTDSSKYLEVILKKAKKQGWRINNVGVMIECAKPKIDPLNSKIKKSLAAILDVDSAKVGITATTGEKLTSFGKGLGVQCFAIVSLVK